MAAKHRPAPPRTKTDAGGVHYTYDEAEYERWLAGGPAPTPIRVQSAVKEDEPVTTQTRRNPAAIFRRGTFTRQQAGARRLIAVGLFLISVAGAVIWGGGGPAAWLALAPLWWGVGGALALQGLCTYGQWVFGGPGWWNPLYLAAWGVSTLTTVLGYWPLVHDWLSGAVRGLAGPETSAGYYAPWIAGAIIVIVAGLLDWLPEQTLLD